MMTAEFLRRLMLHADKTPVAMLKPAGQRDAKAHPTYLRNCRSTQFSPPADDAARVVGRLLWCLKPAVAGMIYCPSAPNLGRFTPPGAKVIRNRVRHCGTFVRR